MFGKLHALVSSTPKALTATGDAEQPSFPISGNLAAPADKAETASAVASTVKSESTEEEASRSQPLPRLIDFSASRIAGFCPPGSLQHTAAHGQTPPPGGTTPREEFFDANCELRGLFDYAMETHAAGAKAAAKKAVAAGGAGGAAVGCARGGTPRRSGAGTPAARPRDSTRAAAAATFALREEQPAMCLACYATPGRGKKEQTPSSPLGGAAPEGARSDRASGGAGAAAGAFPGLRLLECAVAQCRRRFCMQCVVFGGRSHGLLPPLGAQMALMLPVALAGIFASLELAQLAQFGAPEAGDGGGGVVGDGGGEVYGSGSFAAGSAAGGAAGGNAGSVGGRKGVGSGGFSARGTFAGLQATGDVAGSAGGEVGGSAAAAAPAGSAAAFTSSLAQAILDDGLKLGNLDERGEEGEGRAGNGHPAVEAAGGEGSKAASGARGEIAGGVGGRFAGPAEPAAPAGGGAAVASAAAGGFCAPLLAGRTHICAVCNYQMHRSRPAAHAWHWSFHDGADARFARALRESLPAAAVRGLFLEIHGARPACWRRRTPAGRKHYSLKLYGGLLEARAVALFSTGLFAKAAKPAAMPAPAALAAAAAGAPGTTGASGVPGAALALYLPNPTDLPSAPAHPAAGSSGEHPTVGVWASPSGAGTDLAAPVTAPFHPPPSFLAGQQAAGQAAGSMPAPAPLAAGPQSAAAGPLARDIMFPQKVALSAVIAASASPVPAAASPPRSIPTFSPADFYAAVSPPSFSTLDAIPDAARHAGPETFFPAEKRRRRSSTSSAQSDRPMTRSRARALRAEAEAEAALARAVRFAAVRV